MDLDGILLNGEPCNEFLFLFNRSHGSPKVHYLMIDSVHGKRTQLLPMTNFIKFEKIKDVIGYRTVVVDNYLYILGGRHLDSGSILSHCYRYNPVNNRWVRIAPMIYARYRFTANLLDGFIYVCGE